MLSHEQDAEDAFQATFLVLARKAASVRWRSDIGNWLYSVAQRIALKAQASAAAQRHLERPMVEMTVADRISDLAWQELRPVVDEEVNRLPAKYREPFVLCYLEERTYTEVAKVLGVPEGTVSGRLARAREMLRGRLTRRGLTLSGGALATVLSQNAVAAAPGMVVQKSVQAIQLFESNAAVTGDMSAQVIALTEGVLHVMNHTKLITLAAVLITGSALIGTGSWYRSHALVGMTANEVQAAPHEQPVSVQLQKTEKSYQEELSQRDGVLWFNGTQIGPGEEVTPNVLLTIVSGGKEMKFRRLKEGDRVRTGQLLAQLDDRVARDELDVQQAKLMVAEADRHSLEKHRDEAKTQYDTAVRLYGKDAKAISLEQVQFAKLAWEKYYYEEVSKREQVTLASAEVKRAQRIVGMHEIRNSVNGVIRKIYKHPGEAVKQLEPLFQIEIEEKK